MTVDPDEAWLDGFWAAAAVRMDEEENAVRQLGELIGYGRMMQLAEQLWRKKLEPEGLQGGEHTTGPCATFMVACPHPANGQDRNGHCDWCCGSGRVTKKVREAMGNGHR